MDPTLVKDMKRPVNIAVLGAPGAVVGYFLIGGPVGVLVGGVGSWVVGNLVIGRIVHSIFKSK